MLDSKDPADRAVAAHAPRLLDYLAPASRARFERIQDALRALAIPYALDPTLVRGLDYYGETVFEFVSVGAHLGAHATVLAGGRYDELVSVMGGRATPAVGCVGGRGPGLASQGLGRGVSALKKSVLRFSAQRAGPCVLRSDGERAKGERDKGERPGLRVLRFSAQRAGPCV